MLIMLRRKKTGVPRARAGRTARCGPAAGSVRAPRGGAAPGPGKQQLNMQQKVKSY